MQTYASLNRINTATASEPQPGERTLVTTQRKDSRPFNVTSVVSTPGEILAPKKKEEGVDAGTVQRSRRGTCVGVGQGRREVLRLLTDWVPVLVFCCLDLVLDLNRKSSAAMSYVGQAPPGVAELAPAMTDLRQADELLHVCSAIGIRLESGPESSHVYTKGIECRGE